MTSDSTLINLGEPTPRRQERRIEEAAYAVTGRTYLPVPGSCMPVAFFDVVEARATRRTFGPLAVGDLSALLWFTAKTRQVRALPGGGALHHRPVASAGARHPIDLLIVRRERGDWAASIYDEVAHALCALDGDSCALGALVQAVAAVVDVGEGTVIWQVARPGRTLAKYERGESLIWRDSGVLLGHLLLVCEALGLNACPVGLTGQAQLQQVVRLGDAWGTGGCVVGARTAVEGLSPLAEWGGSR